MFAVRKTGLSKAHGLEPNSPGTNIYYMYPYENMYIMDIKKVYAVIHKY